MAATWEDIRRLVTDLQRVQLTQSAKKLSEANCVEVVSKLIQRSMIDVVFTRDGHSYITRSHLATEALGGRAPLTDIAATLNVDLDHVEHVALKLVSENVGLTISGGELFSEPLPINVIQARVGLPLGQFWPTFDGLVAAGENDADWVDSRKGAGKRKGARGSGGKANKAETLNTYVSELKEQVLSESEPAAKLLSCVLFLLAKHEKPVAASGRFVAQLVSELEGFVDQPTFDLLVSCQRLVVQCLKYKDDEEAKAMLISDIEKLKQKVIV
ncbi:unnamed protein product [Angiostrongylus costaricensis]|uniref:E3 UFM1-protein ligase 1 homolog n=1 Tax=Angiostrongylus costaricensis TaxID=334426 RepID=A0A158PLH4_ANGCS|nr:unnamed protein product [Angiostrongylus costaricensis]